MLWIVIVIILIIVISIIGGIGGIFTDLLGTKKCPHCAEDIKIEAKVCKFCGNNVENMDMHWGSRIGCSIALIIIIIVVISMIFGC